MRGRHLPRRSRSTFSCDSLSSLLSFLPFCLAPRRPSHAAEPSSIRKPCTGGLCFPDSILRSARDSIDDAVSVLTSASHLSSCISLEGFISFISYFRTHGRAINVRYSSEVSCNSSLQHLTLFPRSAQQNPSGSLTRFERVRSIRGSS